MTRRNLTDDERAVFDQASRLAATLRSEGRQLDPEFGTSLDVAADRALYEIQHQGAYIAIRTHIGGNP